MARGSTNSISNKYNINSFYYLTGNHKQKRFQSDYKLLTWLYWLSYLSNVNTCKYGQVFMMITYVNNKSSSFHSISVGYTIQ
jgi:hypothetical protein